jgi:hypothetical protein
VCAGVDRAQSEARVVERGHEDHRWCALDAAWAFAQAGAVQVRHAHVTQHDVDRDVCEGVEQCFDIVDFGEDGESREAA